MTPIILPIAELRPALTGLGKVISTKSSLTLLHHVKVERSADGWIALTATDLDRFITVRLEHPSEGELATVLVPYEQLQQVSKSCGKGESLHLIPDPKAPMLRFSLGAGTGESPIKPMKVDEFPLTPRIQSDPIPLNTEFRRFLQEAMTCCCADSSRPALGGVCIDVSNPKGSYIVATDGKHLYSANSFTLPLKQSLLIPANKFLAWKDFNLDGEWQLRADNRFVQFRSRRWRFVSRLIPHKYPDWRAVVPAADSARTHLTLPQEQLESLTKLIQRLPNHDDRFHSLGLKWNGKELSLLSKSEPQDDWTEHLIPETHGRGPAQTVMFDRRLLLKAFSYGLNQISLIDECSPLRFSNQGKQLIVMPIRIESPPPTRQSSVNPAVSKAAIPEVKPSPPPTNPKAIPMSNPPQADTPETGSSPAIIEEALTLCGTLRDRFQEGLNQLRDLGSKLKLVQREQRTVARDMSSVRSTLRSLQGLKL